jgi:hypothetical protein
VFGCYCCTPDCSYGIRSGATTYTSKDSVCLWPAARRCPIRMVTKQVVPNSGTAIIASFISPSSLDSNPPPNAVSPNWDLHLLTLSQSFSQLSWPLNSDQGTQGASCLSTQGASQPRTKCSFRVRSNSDVRLIDNIKCSNTKALISLHIRGWKGLGWKLARLGDLGFKYRHGALQTNHATSDSSLSSPGERN